jgi:hypothetical protein
LFLSPIIALVDSDRTRIELCIFVMVQYESLMHAWIFCTSSPIGQIIALPNMCSRATHFVMEVSFPNELANHWILCRTDHSLIWTQVAKGQLSTWLPLNQSTTVLLHPLSFSPTSNFLDQGTLCNTSGC